MTDTHRDRDRAYELEVENVGHRCCCGNRSLHSYESKSSSFVVVRIDCSYLVDVEKILSCELVRRLLCRCEGEFFLHDDVQP